MAGSRIPQQISFLPLDGRSKQCLECLQVLPLNAFYRAKVGRFGRMTQCAKCIESKRKKGITYLPIVKPAKPYCPITHNYCNKCQQVLLVSRFAWRKGSEKIRQGWSITCRKCDCEQVKAYRSSPRGRATINAYAKTEKGRIQQRKDRASRKRRGVAYKKNLEARLRLNYGITLDDYHRTHEAQKGLCAICGQPAKEGERLVVDHCHSTNKFRGLLCHKHNLGLGLFGDNTDYLYAAIKYLQNAAEEIERAA